MSRATPTESQNEAFDRDLQNRSLVFSSIFSLPGEELVDDFTCALLKSSVLLFQGRMFVSRDHICFYSALLSTEERTLIIPFNDIAEIAKKNTAWIVPNAIEIKLKSGSEFFFGSFLSRNRCYDLLEKIFEGELMPELSSSSQPPSSAPYVSQSADTANDRLQSPSDSLAQLNEPIPNASISDQVCMHQPSKSEDLLEEINFEHFERALSNTLWGKPDLEFQEIGRAELPLSTKDVFAKLYADSGTVLSVQQHFDSLGAKDVHFNKWRHENRVMVRDGSLIMPITNPLSTTKNTRVQETSYCCYNEKTRSFHLRSQSNSLDAPYGSYFTVLLAYDFIPTDCDERRCYVNARVAVHFLKSVWAVKSLIVSGAVDGVRSSFAAWSKAVVSVCSEGEEIPLSPIRKKSIDSIVKQRRRSNSRFYSLLPVNYSLNFVSEQKYLVLFSLWIACVAMWLALGPIQIPSSSSDLCNVLPHVLALCNQKDSKLPDLLLAEMYNKAVMMRLRSMGKSFPEDVVFALQEANEILGDYMISSKTLNHTASIIDRLHASTSRLR